MMSNKKIIIFVSFIIVGFGILFWIFNNQYVAKHKAPSRVIQDLFIQATPNDEILDVLSSLKKSLHPIINDIIKKELGLASDYDLEFFHPKGHNQRLTLYYLRNVDSGGIDLVSAGVAMVLKNNSTAFMVHNVTLKPEVHFFGKHDDELVIMVDDSNRELAFLHEALKNEMNGMNEQYKTMHHAEMYDVSNSEKFPYTPHIGLGRISSKIKKHIKDESQVDTVYSRIREKILRATLVAVKKLFNANNSKITFTLLCLFDPSITHRLLAENVSLDEASKRACIMEFVI